MLPAVKKEIFGEGGKIMKEGFSSCQRFSQGLIGGVNKFQESVGQESQQIEGQQGLWEELLAMAVIVF